MKQGLALVVHWFSFVGRMGRGDYNSVNLVAVVLLVGGQLVFVMPLLTMDFVNSPMPVRIPLGWNAVIAVAMIGCGVLISVSSTVRRLHDFGWSGWWMALCLAPLQGFAVFAGILGMLILAFFRGERKSNRYGKKTPPNQLV